MEVFTLLLLGTVIGMQHAMEADHLAAVAALSSKRISRRAMVLRGSVWGLGHTITLLTICGALLLLEETMSARTEALLELAVGAMIVLLGVNLLVQLWRRSPHFHIHSHRSGEQHMHVHTHVEDRVAHAVSPHEHAHHNLGLGRALLVGMMHGTAGSAGLLILAAAANTLSTAVAYVLAFATGSIIGMAALSFVIAWPLRWMERCANWVTVSAFAGVGCAAIIIGGALFGRSWNLL